MDIKKEMDRLEEANELYKNKKYDEAISIYENYYQSKKKELCIDDKSLQICQRLADCYYYIGNYEE